MRWSSTITTNIAQGLHRPLLKFDAVRLGLRRRSRETRAYGHKWITPILFHDAVLAALSVGAAFTLRLGQGAFEARYLPIMLLAMVAFVVIAVPTFYVFRLHRAAWRYASVTDLMAIIKAVTLASLIFLLLVFVAGRSEDLPRSIPIIQWCVLILALGGSRMTYRWAHDRRVGRTSGQDGAKPIPVLLLGIGSETQLFLRAIEAGHAPLHRVVGILDVDTVLVGRSINGVPVLGSVGDLVGVMARLAQAGNRPQRLIVTRAVDRIENKRKLFEQGSIGRSGESFWEVCLDLRVRHANRIN
jgi:FlaA1/EpsC-like NDP-sugar epimerase